MTTETIAICTSSFNTLTSRFQGLEKCLHGLRDSYNHFKMIYPDVEVIFSWTDDSSTDYTADHVEEFFIENNLPYKMTRLKVNSHQAFGRNLAAKIVESDYIMIADSDDVFRPEHIQACYEAIQSTDCIGRKLGYISTLAHFDESLKIHADWIPRISQSIPITKMFRREVWEFLEGFPCNDIYKTTGCEDQALSQSAMYFFPPVLVNIASVEYCNYPGSFFDRQLAKFQEHPDKMKPDEHDQKHTYLHFIRTKFEAERLEYLKAKLCGTHWYETLKQYSVNYV